jgi:hypothetical protein
MPPPINPAPTVAALRTGCLGVSAALQEVVALDRQPCVEIVEFDGRFDALERHAAVELTAQSACQVCLGFFENASIGAVGGDSVGLVAHQRMVAAGGGFALGERDGAGDQVTVDDLVDDAERACLFGG